MITIMNEVCLSPPPLKRSGDPLSDAPRRTPSLKKPQRILTRVCERDTCRLTLASPKDRRDPHTYARDASSTPGRWRAYRSRGAPDVAHAWNLLPKSETCCGSCPAAILFCFLLLFIIFCTVLWQGRIKDPSECSFICAPSAKHFRPFTKPLALITAFPGFAMGPKHGVRVNSTDHDLYKPFFVHPNSTDTYLHYLKKNVNSSGTFCLPVEKYEFRIEQSTVFHRN